jgi:hypothetical protein
VTGVITAADVVGPSSQGVTAGEFADLLNVLRQRETYVNVHTTRSPGGTIRELIKVSARLLFRAGLMSRLEQRKAACPEPFAASRGD